MTRTEAQKRDAYYRKKYGVGLDWYEAKFEEQGRACGICKEPPEEGVRLAVDHDHKWKYFKLDTWKEDEFCWASRLAEEQEEFCAQAYRDKPGICYIGLGQKKHQAIQEIRRELQRLSVRGLLCFKCNTTLRKLYDNATIAANAAEYLRKHQNA